MTVLVVTSDMIYLNVGIVNLAVSDAMVHDDERRGTTEFLFSFAGSSKTGI